MFHGFKDHWMVKGEESIFTGTIKGFTFLAERLVKKYPEYKIIFVMDGRCSKKDIDENYKANRDKDKSQMRADTEKIVNILSNLSNVRFAKSDEHEADDLIASIAFELKERGSEDIIIYSGDKDFYQLANIFRVSNDYDKGFKFVDSRTVFEKFETTIDNLLAYRILEGDTSDNLKAPVPFVKKEFKRLFAERWVPTESAKIPEVIESFSGDKWEKTAKKYLDVLDIIDNYLDIMDLKKYEKVENRIEYRLFKSNPDMRLIQFYELRQFEILLFDLQRSTVVV